MIINIRETMIEDIEEITRRSWSNWGMTSEDREAILQAALQVESIWEAEELRRAFFRYRNIGIKAWRKLLDDAAARRKPEK
jgi:hypothetical protein